MNIICSTLDLTQVTNTSTGDKVTPIGPIVAEDLSVRLLILLSVLASITPLMQLVPCAAVALAASLVHTEVSRMQLLHASTSNTKAES